MVFRYWRRFRGASPETVRGADRDKSRWVPMLASLWRGPAGPPWRAGKGTERDTYDWMGWSVRHGIAW
eukprot:7360457-Pyramimonas_sp.AAC.1